MAIALNPSINSGSSSYQCPYHLAPKLEAYKNYIRQLAKQAGHAFPNSINAYIANDPAEIPHATDADAMFLPVLMLLDKQDIPEHLRLRSHDDPRLFDDFYLDEVINWLKDYTKNPNFNNSFVQKELIRTFLKLLVDDVKSKDAKMFILGHELAHILHKHETTYGHVYWTLLFILSIALVCVLIPFGSSVAALMTAAKIGACSMGALSAIAWIVMSRTSKAEEKEADMTSKRITQKNEGGAYFFEVMRQHGLAARNKSPTLAKRLLARLTYDSQGQVRAFKLTHPSESERVAYLKS